MKIIEQTRKPSRRLVKHSFDVTNKTGKISSKHCFEITYKTDMV
ncbi:hypothetical protein [Streptococcus sp.]